MLLVYTDLVCFLSSNVYHMLIAVSSRSRIFKSTNMWCYKHLYITVQIHDVQNVIQKNRWYRPWVSFYPQSHVFFLSPLPPPSYPWVRRQEIQVWVVSSNANYKNILHPSLGERLPGLISTSFKTYCFELALRNAALVQSSVWEEYSVV